jgi:protein-tyrosine phosphatase
LELLCTEGTNLLLLEMPFTSWSESMIAEVNEMARNHRVQLIMAHIERYYFKQKVSVWDEFLSRGIVMQSNADFFLSFWEGRKALKLLREGRIHLLGTDCHNMKDRRPRMDEAVRRIQRTVGSETLEEIDQLGHRLLQEVLP